MDIKKLIAMAMLAAAQAVVAQPSNTRTPTLADPNRTFTYDRAGNTISDSAGYTATYNLRGQLATITKAGITTTYTYNAAGQRVRKVSSKGPASTVLFAYDQEGHLLGEYDPAGEALREYVWLGDEPVAVFTPDPANPRGAPLVYYIHTDHLNTPRIVVDRDNVVRWRWISEPFGTAAPDTNPSGLGEFTFNLRFPGQYADQESGLFYNYARSYDSSRGAYTQSDPIGLAGGVNTYAYVNGRPTQATDPSGLWSTDAHNSLINAAFAGLSPALLQKIKDGSAAVDALTNQFGDGSFMHAMRAPAESIEDARRRACEFLRSNIAVFNALKNSPVSKNQLSAYYALGQALHVVMDSTSPEHRGWQVWNPRPSDLWNTQSQPWRHGDHSPEDLAHLTPDLRRETIEKMLNALKSGNCDCLN